jgi:hypothetical protein
MKKELFNKAWEIDEYIRQLSIVIEDYEENKSDAHFVYSLQRRSGHIYLPNQVAKDIIEVVKRHKEQLEKEFEEL